MFWLIYPFDDAKPLRFFFSYFDDLMVWQEIAITPAIVVSAEAKYYFLAAVREPLHFYNGYLYLMDVSTPGPDGAAFTDGSVNWKRCKVDGGEDAPPMKFNRYDYRAQMFRLSSGGTLIGGKHGNWGYNEIDEKWYQMAGDHGESFTAAMGRLTFDATPRGYTFNEQLTETEPMPPGLYRPIAPDDGAWAYCGAANPNAALRGKFIWARGGDGAGFSSNVYTRAAYQPYARKNPAGWASGADDGSDDAIAKMQADGWTASKFVVYDPATNAGKGSFQPVDTTVWPCAKGNWPVTHPSLMGSAACRNGCFDQATNTFFRFVDYNSSLALAAYNFDAQTVRLWAVNLWTHPVNRRDYFLDGQPPPAASMLVDDGFGWFDPASGRWHSGAATAWEHKAVWVDKADGKLYCVSPQTGYLWCYETRGQELSRGSDGALTIQFGPVGTRIPITGPVPDAADAVLPLPSAGVQRRSPHEQLRFAAIRGGLLYWSSGTVMNGVSGVPAYCFWRRLGFAGPWSPVTLPHEFYANACGAKSLSADNDEILALERAYTSLEWSGTEPGPLYFHRIT